MILHLQYVRSEAATNVKLSIRIFGCLNKRIPNYLVTFILMQNAIYKLLVAVFIISLHS